MEGCDKSIIAGKESDNIWGPLNVVNAVTTTAYNDAAEGCVV